MPSPTATLFRKMKETAENDLATLESTLITEGDEAPTRAECTAIQRVQKSLRQLITTLRAEVADLG